MVKENRMMELYIAPVIRCENKKRIAFKTQVRINNTELGTLLPDVYGHIADKTVQSKRIFDWAYKELLICVEIFKKNDIEFDFITLYTPQKVLEDDKAVMSFVSEVEKSGIEPNRFALEIYPEYMLDRESKTFRSISVLREKGFRIILLNYASENFPLSVISFVPADILCLDRFVTDCIDGDRNEREYAKSAIFMANNIGKQIIAENIDTPDSYRTLSAFSNYCYGKHLGNYIKYKYVRAKWIEKV